jgi:hypothetical protein
MSALTTPLERESLPDDERGQLDPYVRLQDAEGEAAPRGRWHDRPEDDEPAPPWPDFCPLHHLAGW